MRGSTYLLGLICVVTCCLLVVNWVCPSVVNADPVRQQSSMQLVSPNGQFTLTLEATDAYSGIWVRDRASGEVAALYIASHEGPVVGVGDDPAKTKGWEAALHRERSRGGHLQIIERVISKTKTRTEVER